MKPTFILSGRIDIKSITDTYTIEQEGDLFNIRSKRGYDHIGEGGGGFKSLLQAINKCNMFLKQDEFDSKIESSSAL